MGISLNVRRLEDSRRRYAVRQEIVELGPDLQDARRRVLIHNLLGYDPDKRLPVRGRDRCGVGDFFTGEPLVVSGGMRPLVGGWESLLLRMDSFVH